jgi:hypothetical protein
MGKAVEQWLTLYSSPETKKQYKWRFNRFAKWVVVNQILPIKQIEKVDDYIQKDFKNHLNSGNLYQFRRKYKSIISKYAAYLSTSNVNTARNMINPIRSFFSNELDVRIKLRKGTVPLPDSSKNDHVLTIEELRQMYAVADIEGKAKLSTAVSLGWRVSDFLNLTVAEIKHQLSIIDSDGYCYWKTSHNKTRHQAIKVFAILNPLAVHDLKAHLEQIPPTQKYLWKIRTTAGMTRWVRRLFQKAGLKTKSRVRFHLIRKYTESTIMLKGGAHHEAKLLVGHKIHATLWSYIEGYIYDSLLDKYKAIYPEWLRLDLNAQAYQQKELKDIKERLLVLEEFITKVAESYDLGFTFNQEHRLLEIHDADKIRSMYTLA